MLSSDGAPGATPFGRAPGGYIETMMAGGQAARLFILFGTPVYATAPYLLLMLVFGFLWGDGSWQKAFLAVFAITTSILVHEFGHVFAARLNGHRSTVVLVGLGGMTIPDGESTKWRGVMLSLAGPAAGLLFGAVVYLGFPPGRDLGLLEFLANRGAIPAEYATSLWPYLQRTFVWVCLAWSIFNLLPIVPMDGGHALRDFLDVFMRRYEAERIAAWVSIVVAVPIAVLFYSGGILFGAVLVGFMAWQNFESLRKNR